MESSEPSNSFFLSLLASANRQVTNNGTDTSPEIYNRYSKFLVGLFGFELPETTGRKPLTIETFTLYFIVPILLNYAMAYLVLVPGTRLLRLAILPITLWTSFTGATTLDLMMGYGKLGQEHINQTLTIQYAILNLRNITWALETRPYRRIISQSRGVAAKRDSQFQSVGPYPFRDAFELMFNLRGLGWDWSRNLYVPPEWRCTSSRTRFTLQTIASLVFSLVWFDLCYYGAQYYSPTKFGTGIGRNIYAPGLTLRQQFIQSNIVVILCGFKLYAIMQNMYDFATLVGVLVFRQDPTAWPPIFETPFLSTSLKELWSKRWHQHFRDNFIQNGARPFSILFGRTGGMVGAFLVSAVYHDIVVWGMGNGDEFGTMGGFFLLMAILMIVEALWTKITGRKVGGVLGWLWVITVTTTCAHVLIDGWARKGLLGLEIIPGAFRPAYWVFGPLPV